MTNIFKANLLWKAFCQPRNFTLRLQPVMRVTPLLVKLLVVLSICAALIVPGPLLKRGKASADIVGDVKTRAAQYTQALREINVVTTMPLSTRQDVQRAVEILKKQDPIIRTGIYSRMAVVAMSNTTLKQSVENHAARLGAKVLLDRVLRDPRSVWNFEGSQAAAESVKRQLRADAEIMNRAGTRLKEAIAKQTRSAPTLPGRSPASLNLDGPLFHHRHEPLDPTPLPQGWEEVLAGALLVAVVAIITAWGVAKSQDFQEPQNPAPGVDSRSDFKRCIDRCYERRETCLKENAGNFLGQSGCWAVYSLDMSICLLLPQ